MTRGDPSFPLKGNAVACAASIPTSPVSGKLPTAAEKPGSNAATSGKRAPTTRRRVSPKSTKSIEISKIASNFNV